MSKLPKNVSTSILLLLLRSDGLTMSGICQGTKFSTITVLKHVNALVEAGMLMEEREGQFPRRRIIKATDEGLRVASLLNLSEASKFSSSELIEMGAKAGRMASYQEMISQLRAPNITREYLTVELLLKTLSALASGLLAVYKGLPEDMSEKGGRIKSLSFKINEHQATAQKLLSANNINGCSAEVSKAFAEFNGSSDLMKEIVKVLKERKFDEIANYAEFLSPKVTKKE